MQRAMHELSSDLLLANRQRRRRNEIARSVVRGEDGLSLTVSRIMRVVSATYLEICCSEETVRV